MQGSGKFRGRRGYAEEFKQRVLARLESGEASLRQVAREFEVSVPTLIKWRKEQAASGKRRAVAPTAQSPQEQPATELERLREEVEQLKQERDRLRQGIAILAGLKYEVTP